MHKSISHRKSNYALLSVIGVVFGDIGSSPLYALKSCFSISQIEVNAFNVVGLVSLFIWCLFFVVSLKYITLALKIDHQGEGGILALSTLVSSQTKHRRLAIILGILGVCFFFGDGIVTPAISVLSAIEGISLINNNLTTYVFPITFLIITFLFLIQKFGTDKIGSCFGPIMIVWFSTLLALGVYNVYHTPGILRAFNPYHAISFIINHQWVSVIILGGVILVITGAEALYADLGHFGRKPIAVLWNLFVFPSLVFNYLGQGALLLKSPAAIENSFYLMAPESCFLGLIIIATLATIIASQSILTGIFSISHQAILLNYFPRLQVSQTSKNSKGQIYIPGINIVMYLLTIACILKFNSSENLAAAYGLCVAFIMLITSVLIFILKYEDKKWSKIRLFSLFIPLVFLDIFFVFSNLVKFFDGAWYALAIAVLVYYCIDVWRKGSEALEKQKFISTMSLNNFLEKNLKGSQNRIPGSAIFLCRAPFKIPTALALIIQHNKYLHEKVFFVSFMVVDTPYYNTDDRFSIHEIGHGCHQIVARLGFMQKPSMHKLLNLLDKKRLLENNEDISIFLSKGVPVKTKSKNLTGFAENVYYFLSLISQNATDFFSIPHDKVIELGIRYKI